MLQIVFTSQKFDYFQLLIKVNYISLKEVVFSSTFSFSSKGSKSISILNLKVYKGVWDKLQNEFTMSSRYNLRSKSKQSVQKEEQHPIFSLPIEMLDVILHNIPQNVTPNLRLVCRAWNNDVENWYNHEVNGLDEDSPHFRRILKLRIHKLSIRTLRKTSVLNSAGISIFKHPQLIRVLKTNLFSCVSPGNLTNLLALCAETVRVLHLSLSQEHLEYEFASQEVLEGYKFSNLKELKVSFRNSDPFHKTVSENSKSLFQVLENSRMPGLKVLGIKLYSSSSHILSFETKGRIAESIFRILSRNGINLEILDLNIFNYEYGSELDELTLTLEKNELDRLMQMDRIQAFDVRFQPFALQLKHFWQQVLSNQKQLVELETWKFPGAPISIPLCRQIVMKNSATLVNIGIYELDMLADDPPFDLSVFKACCNLQELYLETNASTRTDPEQPHVREFHRLPESITKMTLVSLKILSEELLIGFTHGLNNLQKLSFEKCGMRGLLGVNWPVLSEILKLSRPSLTEVRFYRSVNCEDESLEIELGQLGLSLSDLSVLRRDCSVEPGHFDWIHYDSF